MQIALKSATALLSLAGPAAITVNKRSLTAISDSCDRIQVFGISYDQYDVNQLSYDGKSWDGWFSLGTATDSLFRNAPSAVYTRKGVFDIHVTDTSDNLKVRHFNGTWFPSDGFRLFKPNIVDAGSPIAMLPLWKEMTWKDRTNVFVRDTGNDLLMIYGNSENLNTGTAYFRISTSSTPVAVMSGLGTMELLYLSLDNQVQHAHYYVDPTYGQYTWDTSSNGLAAQQFISPPTAVSSGSGRVDVFGIAPGGNVAHSFYQVKDGGRGVWAAWESLGSGGGGFSSSIAAVAPLGTNRIAIWGLGLDKAVYFRTFDGAAWSLRWAAAGNIFISAPTLVSSCPGTYDVFGIGNDNAVWHVRRNETANTWSPGYQRWESLGGWMRTFA